MSHRYFKTEVDDSRHNRMKEEPHRSGNTDRSNVVVKEESDRPRVKRERRDGDRDLYQGYDQV